MRRHTNFHTKLGLIQKCKHFSGRSTAQHLASMYILGCLVLLYNAWMNISSPFLCAVFQFSVWDCECRNDVSLCVHFSFLLKLIKYNLTRQSLCMWPTPPSKEIWADLQSGLRSNRHCQVHKQGRAKQHHQVQHLHVWLSQCWNL